MDGSRFDGMVRALVSGQSRRHVLRLALGGGLAAVTLGSVPEAALACRRNGKPCVKGKKFGDCCSGTCRKGKCRPTPGAAGCTVNHRDNCKGGSAVCPNNANGRCVLLDNGKPFCLGRGVCQACNSNADCTDQAQGKCVQTCEVCTDTNGQGCAYPPVAT